MKPVTKIYLYEGEDKFFGDGPERLLEEIRRTGSLRAAAMEMNLSYSKALHMIKKAEQALGFSLTEKKTGGAGGGGSILTEDAVRFLKKYERFRKLCIEQNEKIYDKVFKVKTGCVIMASGMSRRFGENKLLIDFRGKTLIERALDITEGLFDKRIVLTRDKIVEKICKDKNVEVLLHDYPHRNEAITLGVAAMENMDGVMFCPCDQPLLEKSTIQSLQDAFVKKGSGIFRLSWENTKGAPVIFGREYMDELKMLPEGKGGSYLMDKYKEDVSEVHAFSMEELLDVDTREDYEKLLNI